MFTGVICASDVSIMFESCNPRTERKVLEVLNQASLRIASDIDAFWSAYTHIDIEGAGYIDISKASHFFKSLFHVSSGKAAGSGSFSFNLFCVHWNPWLFSMIEILLSLRVCRVMNSVSWLPTPSCGT